MNPKRILIVAGEPSGDLYASILVKDLKRMRPELEFVGIGGGLSKNAGVDIIFDLSKLALVGGIEVLKNIFVVGRAFKTVISKIDSSKIDLAILVDYPGFNLRLARELKKRRIPVIYYISPQVWAWGAGRIKIIKECVDKIVVFFKFEEELYKRHGINVEFVGHPLSDIVKITSAKADVRKRYNLADNKITIALLPGSRSMEVKKLFPIMAHAARTISERLKNVQFIIVRHPSVHSNLYRESIEGSGVDMAISEGDTYNILAASDFAIVASGTATLETAIVGTPFIMIYKVNFLTYLAAKMLMKVPFLGIVNIIAGNEIIPELLQFDATPDRVAEKTIAIISDKERIAGMRGDLKSVAGTLGEPGASERAAKSILSYL